MSINLTEISELKDKLLNPKNIRITIGVTIVLVLAFFLNWANVKTVTATVADTDMQYFSSSSSRSGTRHKSKIVIITDKGTFQDTTDLLRGKLFGKYYTNIKPGETYKFKVSGIAIPIIRIYPNIIALEAVEAPLEAQNSLNKNSSK